MIIIFQKLIFLKITTRNGQLIILHIFSDLIRT